MKELLNEQDLSRVNRHRIDKFLEILDDDTIQVLFESCFNTFHQVDRNDQLISDLDPFASHKLPLIRYFIKNEDEYFLKTKSQSKSTCDRERMILSNNNSEPEYKIWCGKSRNWRSPGGWLDSIMNSVFVDQLKSAFIKAFQTGVPFIGYGNLDDPTTAKIMKLNILTNDFPYGIIGMTFTDNVNKKRLNTGQQISSFNFSKNDTSTVFDPVQKVTYESMDRAWWTEFLDIVTPKNYDVSQNVTESMEIFEALNAKMQDTEFQLTDLDTSEKPIGITNFEQGIIGIENTYLKSNNLVMSRIVVRICENTEIFHKMKKVDQNKQLLLNSLKDKGLWITPLSGDPNDPLQLKINQAQNLLKIYKAIIQSMIN